MVTDTKGNYKMLLDGSCPEKSDSPKPEAVEVKRLDPGKLNGNPKPPYPKEAKKKKAGGTVKIDVVIDQSGKVIWAKIISGPKVFRENSLKAACASKFEPVKVNGNFVNATSVLSYNFQY
jgi:TonB family protein